MKKNKVSALALLFVLLSSNLSGLPVLSEDLSAQSSESSKRLTEETTTEENVTDTAEALPETEATTVASETAPSSVGETTEVSSSSSEETTSEEATTTTESTETTSSKESTTEETSKTSDPSTSTSEEPAKTSGETSPAVTATQSLQTPTYQFVNAVPAYNALAEFDNTVLDNDKLLTYTTYVEHWSGSDAYTHNLLSHRYGITAEQLDGFLQSTGIKYDSKRINGAKLLEWEKKSGLDVRAIVAIAMAESSLGTQGVATHKGANMFGYAAFDLSPNTAENYNDDKAIRKLTSETIVKNKNLTFQVQDEKAKKVASGHLNFATDGGVYFTDTSGTGQRRAQIMENLDRWIDEHGGTPALPEELRQLNTASQSTVPEGFSVDTAVNTTLYTAATYPWGECTWYVYNRAKELGYNFDPYMGNGGDWRLKAGYETTHEPKVGYAVSFAPGQAGADGTYGHVAIVEQVREDGSILISESNAMGRGVVSYRTFTADQAAQLTFVIGHK